MMNDKQSFVRAWRCPPLMRFPAYFALMAVACSDTSSSSGNGSPSGGSSASGGSVTSSGGSSTVATGGMSSGVAATGGRTGGLGGGGTGGVSTVPATGGLATGGVSTGGASSTGTPSGGAATGGTSSAGASSGGTAMGGESSFGGAATGGESSAGTSPGGAATGGASPGGSSGAVPSSGCGKTSTLTFGSVPGESGNSVGVGEGGYVTIQSSGESRGFAMRLPDNYDNNKPYWLVFGFHWNGGNSKEVDTGGSNGYIMAHFGLQALSNNGAIFVAPDGISAGWGNTGGRDLQLVDDMLELIQENYCVDTTHIFANGFSYGGGMSYAIACARANIFRGVAIYEGAQLSGCEGGEDPIAFWQMVGLEDTVCDMARATPLRDKFVANNGCTPQDPPEPPRGPPYLNPGGHICTDYAGCSSGHPLRWCVHQSGHGNAIVDGTADLYNSCATPPNSCSDSCPCTWVPEDVWSFFTAL